MYNLRHRWHNGYPKFYHDYTFDVGSLHVIDYLLFRELASLPMLCPGLAPPYLRFSPADWSRNP